jgi:hypothetical protein
VIGERPLARVEPFEDSPHRIDQERLTMSRTIPVLALFVVTSLPACGGPSEPAKTAEAAKPAETKPADARPAETKGTDQEKADAAKEPVKDAPKADFKAEANKSEAFVGEDPGKAVKLAGAKAWSIGPGDTWAIGLYDFVRSEGTKNVFKAFGGDGEFTVPGAFTLQATAPKGLKKGDPVYVTVVTGAVCGRVISASDKEVKVAFDWADKVDEKTYTPEEVILFEGKLGYGAPVAYKETKDDEWWIPGHLVYSDGKTAWLEGNIKVAANLVRPLDVKKTHKVGDKVLGMGKNIIGGLMPVTVTKVLHDGLEYEIKYEDGATKVADYCTVTSPIK